MASYNVNTMNSQADRNQAKRILDSGSSSSGSGSGSSSGGGSGSGSSGNKTSSGNYRVENLTAEAESKKLEPIKNVANEYSDFWGKQTNEEQRITGNTPSVHIYISKQKLDSNLTRITTPTNKKEEDTDKNKTETTKSTEENKTTVKEPTKEEIYAFSVIDKMNAEGN